jgi:cyclophilin family peptidyl-prolyl cis-trans isomerase
VLCYSSTKNIFDDSIGINKTEKQSNNTMKNATLTLTLLIIATGIFAQGKTEPVIQIGTTYGDIQIKLYNETPLHRDNFLELAREGKYDGSIFHRVINRFMIQGGGSASTGTIDDRPMIDAEIDAKFIHKKGALAAARTGDNVNPERKSSGSQFYIVQGRTYTVEMMTQMEGRLGHTYTDEQKKAYAEVGGTPHLDQQYTVFGEVISGLDVIDKIAEVKTVQGDRPVESVIMKVTVIQE